MNITDLVNVISTVGFPITMCLIMFWYVTKLTKTLSDEVDVLKASLYDNIKKLDDSIDKNTNILVELTTLIKMLGNGKK